MKKSFSALFIIFSLFLSFACKGNVNPSKPEEITTGTITGKAVYQNADESSGITVTLEKTDGLRSLSVVRSIELEFDDFSARSIAGNSTTDKEGNYTFTDVEEGVYTIYASSKDSTEKAVTTNVVVERNASVTADDLKLTATGNISGKITLDNSETESYGFLVYVAGTSYSAMTDRTGTFTISGIPAGAGYSLIVTKQQLTYMFEQPVTVTAKETTTIPAKNFTTSEITAGYTNGKDGTSMKWLGSFASEDEIEEPKYLDAYYNTADGCSYIYDGEKWNLLAKGNAESQDEHSHTYSDEWSSNDEFHWRGATCEHINEITALEPHNDDIVEMMESPMCTDVGYAKYKCSICERVQIKVIPPTGHKYSDEWSYSETYHWKQSVCGHSVPHRNFSHEFSDYEIYQEATETSNTLEKRYCVVCDYFEIKELIGTMKHEHQYDTNFACECGKCKDLSIQEFLSIIGDNVTTITADSSEPGITKVERRGVTNINIYNISINGKFNKESTFPSSLSSANLSGLDTSSVTDMSYMFSNCLILSSLDLSSFDTSNVTDMSYMFFGCNSLKDLDLNNFDTSNVTDMSYMFSDCNSLKNLGLSNFDTSNVTNMAGMFKMDDYSGLSLDVSNFDTSKVTNMSYMFSGCNSFDLSNFDTSNVTDMSYMFLYCELFSELDITNFDTSKVTNMKGMFDMCENLTTLNVTNFNTSNVTDMSYMFYGCRHLPSLDLSSFDTSKVTNMESMFSENYWLEIILVSDFFVTPSLDNGEYMFFNCSSITGAIPYDSSKTDATYANYTTGYFTLKQ